MSQQHLTDRTSVPPPRREAPAYAPHRPETHRHLEPTRSSAAQAEPALSPPPGRAERRRGRRRAPKRTPLLGNYLGYAATFVGAGLISGAIVHHPLDPARYTLIAVVGAAVFLFATVLNEFVLTRQRPGATKVLGVVVASLALSFGIGMLSGGLQHFEDFPERAAMLIPFGLTLSFVAYVLRYEPARWRGIAGPTGALVLVTAAVAFVGLRGIADGMAAESGGGGHSHGEETSGETEAPDEEEPGHDHSPDRGTTVPEEPERTTAPAETADAGHADDGHSH
ncbi:hypothetical protein BN159_1426 [Streptomyces davaonensis JCM 4913]|uniref:Uncharacterized protein n=1 Tax=Streptomyces davaonensis (strain DSM 101723 / JCM 4913 / KCC S-0913 / 768) TaxID=1214101 RepID=K4QYA6_STRDJ|nr:hypothetical protein [Streptomyces davaonensis]CCK25805.1 hypothetical protein BN159_1426 [Streptomyces davaonensis JCM 4913]